MDVLVCCTLLILFDVFLFFLVSASRLTLGHVNEFGVFCSGMEDQPLDEKHQDSSGEKL